MAAHGRSCGASAALALVLLAACAAAQSPLAPHGAYLGCFQLAALQGLRPQPVRYEPATINKCAPLCKGQGHSMNAIDGSYRCYCGSIVPSDDMGAAAGSCAKGADSSVALFYNHDSAATASCRLAPVAMQPGSFNIAYNPDKVSFLDDELTIRMDGDAGTRLATNDGSYLYGQYQVMARVCGASGAVSAFYTRSSDVYDGLNYAVFSEIDVEFLNGNPAVPNSVWFNSYYRGFSGGEWLVRPAGYAPKLGLATDSNAGNTFITYSFSWQPSSVIWFMNGRVMLRRDNDQNITWADMFKKSYSRRYRSPNEASHVTFSIWSDSNATRYFGGKLDPSQSPFTSTFKKLRRILCDNPLPAGPGPNSPFTGRGPAHLYAQLSKPVDVIQERASG